MPPRTCWSCHQALPRPNTATVTLSRAQISAVMNACHEYETGLADNHPPCHPELVCLRRAWAKLRTAQEATNAEPH